MRPGSDGSTAHEALGMCGVGDVEGGLALRYAELDATVMDISGREHGEAGLPAQERGDLAPAIAAGWSLIGLFPPSWW